MCSLLQVPSSVLLRVVQRVAQLAEQPPLPRLTGAEHTQHLLSQLTWREQRTGGGGGGEDGGSSGARRRVSEKVQRLLELAQLRALLAGRGASVLCGAAVALVLSCYPYTAYHAHRGTGGLHLAIAAALQHSPRTIASAHRSLAQQLLDLSPLTAATAVFPASSDSSSLLCAAPSPPPPSLSLVLEQLDVLLHCAPSLACSPHTRSASVHVACTAAAEEVGWGEDEGGEEAARLRAAQVDVSEYIRTEEEVEDWCRIASHGQLDTAAHAVGTS